MTDLLKNIKLLSTNNVANKRVLLRVDFNVSLTPEKTTTDTIRITKALPTIELLLKNNNKIILVSHLDRPEKRDSKYSLLPIGDYLQTLLPENRIILVEDFLSPTGKEQLAQQLPNEIILLENIRFYPGEQTNDEEFAKQLASLADVYVNDAFGVSHRNDASVVGIPKLLPSFCGLLLEKEMNAVTTIMENPKKPVVAIIGGAKISTKIVVLEKLLGVLDYLLLAGGLANTFLLSEGVEIGQSLAEKDKVEEAKRITEIAKEKGAILLLPLDAVGLEDGVEKTYPVSNIPLRFSMLDIGPQTQAAYKQVIAKAKTIIWNGPVGKTEDSRFTAGTNTLFDTIVQNKEAFSLGGGGDTLAAISKKETNANMYVSTGGGAMLELIENGTLPGIEALRNEN